MKQTKHLSTLLLVFLMGTLTVYINQSAQAEPDEVEEQFFVDWADSQIQFTNSTNSPDGARLPKIAVAPNDLRIMVVFNHQESGSATDNDPYYVNSNNNGQTWSTPSPIFTSNGVNSIQPSVSFDDTSKAHAVWVENENKLYYAPQTGWPSTFVEINSGSTGILGVDSPKLIATSTTIMDVVWIEQNDDGFGTPDVYHARTVNGGANWNSTSAADLLSAVDSRSPDMLVEGNTIHLVWQEQDGSGWKIQYAVSTNGGANWSFEFEISDTESGRSAERPSIVRKNGVLEVIYTDKDVGTAAEFLTDQQIRYVTCSTTCTTPSNWSDSIKASGFDVGANTNNSEVIISDMTTLNDCTIVSYHGTIDGLPDNNEVLFNTSSCEANRWLVPNVVTNSNIRSIRPSLATQGEYVYMVFTRAGESPSSEDQIRFLRGELEVFFDPTIYLPLIYK